MGRKLILFLVLWFVPLFTLQAQEQSIVVNADRQPLNRVLINLRNTYHLNVSFNDQLLSKYKITLHQTFNTPQKAITSLLANTPLQFSYNDDVIVIWEPTIPEKKSNERHFLKGYLKDSKSGEPLVYSHILTNDKRFISDVNGYFSTVIDSTKPVQVIFSHLGYYILDTVIRPDTINLIYLFPASIKLSEVEVTGKSIDFISQIGQKPGIIRLNSKVASHLPGYGDNAVFNLLRLQPGILASGEQTNSMIIWGSYAGQSKVIFDGFTIYGLSNFNDNISSFNPLLVNDITVMKGGYDARYGERVGGIVDISGITGNTKKVSGIFSINNMTINSKLEIPVSKRSSIVIGLRHTYFNLYKPVNYLVRPADTVNPTGITINVIPKYTFRDLNIKYSGSTKKNDHYFISLYGSNDIFEYSIDDTVQFREIMKNTAERSTQSGGTLFFGKNWQNNGVSNFMLSFSSLQKYYSDDYRIKKLYNGQVNLITQTASVNKLNEVTLKVENRFPVSKNHTLEFGGGIVSNKSYLQVDTFNVNLSNINISAARLYGYAQDVVSLGNKLTLKAGGRITQAFYLKKVYFEPRLSAVYKPSPAWTFSLAWGLYNQYTALTSTVDEQGNYRFLWTVCDNQDIPVIKAMHTVAGISFAKNGYIFSLEGFYKTVSGLSRFVGYKDIIAPDIYHGIGRSYGIDVMLKKDYRGSTIWIAYSLSQTTEKFDYFRNPSFRRAPQDQLHEVKVGAVVNLEPFYISADYVYGSGFPITFNNHQKIEKNYPYNRLDGSATWRFLNKKVRAEIGISVLNILNTQNIKFSNFEKVPLNQTSSINIYADAIPFTPTLFLKISF